MPSISKSPLEAPPRIAWKASRRGASRRRWNAACIAVVASAATLVGTAGPAAASGGHEGHEQAFRQVNLASDLPQLHPVVLDPAVKNPWGIAFGPNTPLWVSNNFNPASPLTQVTLYKGANGHDPFVKVPLEVTASSPTGIVFNPTSSFKVTQGGVTAPANFLFNEFALNPGPVGEITGWSNASKPTPTTTETEATKDGAFYSGLALVPAKDHESGPRLLAADAQNGTIDVYNGKFKRLTLKHGAFVDPTPNAQPVAPYNVAYLHGRVYVTYAPAPGQPGDSAVSVFTREGKFLKRLVTGGPLVGPWGLAIAPEHWGDFGGALLVGNVDDGTINAFNPRSGHFLGTIEDAKGKPLVNLGLWGIEFGNGVIGTPQTLIFAAGVGSEVAGSPDVYEHGLVGLIEPVRHHDNDGDDD